MVCLSLPLSMVLMFVLGCGGEVFRFTLLATLSSLFPRFLARELPLSSLAFVLMGGVYRVRQSAPFTQEMIKFSLLSPLISSRRA